MENFKLLDDRILVKAEERKEKTDSGIFIPGSVEYETDRGEIISIGQILRDFDSDLEVGDRVIFNKYTGDEITINGESYIMMREYNVYAVID